MSPSLENDNLDTHLAIVAHDDGHAVQPKELEAALSWPKLNLAACPLSTETSEGKPGVVGLYNPQALAGRALSLTAALSPHYMNAYLSGLNDLAQLNGVDQRK